MELFEGIAESEKTCPECSIEFTTAKLIMRQVAPWCDIAK